MRTTPYKRKNIKCKFTWDDMNKIMYEYAIEHDLIDKSLSLDDTCFSVYSYDVYGDVEEWCLVHYPKKKEEK